MGVFWLVHLTRLELAHPKALPPQGSVYTNFTTGAWFYYSILTLKIQGVRFLVDLVAAQEAMSVKRSSAVVNDRLSPYARTFLL